MTELRPSSEQVFKMEPIIVQPDCVGGFDTVSNLENKFGNNVKVNLTLELRSRASKIKQPHVSATANNSEHGASRVEYKMKTKSAYDANDCTSNCNKPALTLKNFNMFSLGIIEETGRNETNFGNKCTDDGAHNDYSSGNHVKIELASKDKYIQPIVNGCSSSDITLLSDNSDSLHRTAAYSKFNPQDTENIGGGNNNVKNYNEHETVLHESQVGLHSGIAINDCYENIEGRTCFSAELHMICDNQEDLFSEQAAQMVIASGSECCSDCSCHHNSTGSGLQVGLSDDFKHENVQIQANMNDEFHSDQYENIEFSSIFSSVDIYQRSPDQSYTIENAPLSQESNESCHNFIIDLDGQPCEKSMSDSGVFGLSLSDTGSTEFIQSDEMQYFHRNSSSDHFAVGLRAEQNNSILFKPEGHNSTATVSNTPTNATFSDPNTQQLNHFWAGHREYHPGVHHKSSASTVTSNSTALSYHCGLFDKPASVPPFYDPCINDYSENYQRHLYQRPYGYPSMCAEWNPGAKGSVIPYDIHSPFISKHIADDMCSVSSVDIIGNVVNPETVQTDIKEDEEETDDADEIDYLPVYFNTKNDYWSNHAGIESVDTTTYHGDNSSAGYSPSVLTPPPSASSTPVPSSSQDNCNCDNDFYATWPSSHYETKHTYSSSAVQAHACRLKSEQLETSLLSFGLSQGTKRPFPSMADVMRSSRSKPASRKKYSLEAYDQQPRRSGRPRKTQIQSDKISTTAMSNKQRKKSASKSKCDMVVQDGTGPTDSPKDQMEAGSNKISVAARHNEPLNQHAIEIMSQWFEDHIGNPYPNKADKEKMAIQGGISENQITQNITTSYRDFISQSLTFSFHEKEHSPTFSYHRPLEKVKSWFANKRNRTNNTKPKVQKRAMEEKLKEIFRDLKRNNQNPMADNSHVIQQLSGIIQHCHTAKLD